MRIKYYFIASILAISITSLSATVYEDGENATENWVVYDNKPSGATISNIYDTEYNTNVIKLEGKGRKNSYFIGARKGTKMWNNTTEKYLSWRMNFNEKYKLKVYIETKLGDRVLYYNYKDKDKGIYKKKIIHIGLGSKTKKGKWNYIERNIQADLIRYEPNNNLIAVNGIKIQGSGKIDAIELNKKQKNRYDTGYLRFGESDIIKIQDISNISKQEVDLGDGTSIKKHCIENDQGSYTCNVIAINQEGEVQDLTNKVEVFTINKNTGSWETDDYDTEIVNYTFNKEGNTLHMLRDYYKSTDANDGDSDSHLSITLFDVSDSSNIKKGKRVSISNASGGYLAEDNTIISPTYDAKDHDVIPDEGQVIVKNIDTSESETYNRNRTFYYFSTNQQFQYGFKGVDGRHIVSGTASIAEFSMDKPQDSEMKKVFELSNKALGYVIPRESPFMFVLEEENKIEVILLKSKENIHTPKVDSEGDYILLGTIHLDFDATDIAYNGKEKLLIYNKTKAQYFDLMINISI